jgi:hypothetical protein
MLNHTDAMWRFTDTRRRDMLAPTTGRPNRQPDVLLAAISDSRHAVSKPVRQRVVRLTRPNLVRRVLALAQALRAQPAA